MPSSPFSTSKPSTYSDGRPWTWLSRETHPPVVSAVATRSYREACAANESAVMDGASSSDEDGTETALGGSAWVQAPPVGPTHMHPPRHPLQDCNTPPSDGPPVCSRGPLRLRTNSHWRNVRHVHGTTGSSHPLMQSRGDGLKTRRHRQNMASHVLGSQPLCSPQAKSCGSSQQESFGRSDVYCRGVAGSALGRGSDELVPQPRRRAADRGRGRSPRKRGAPKRRNLGLHSETRPLGIREPRQLGSQCSWRAWQDWKEA